MVTNYKQQIFLKDASIVFHDALMTEKPRRHYQARRK